MNAFGFAHQDIDMSAPIVVAGAGLAGSLIAILLAKRGADVVLIERRSDLREDERAAGRSINLALSERGLHALHMAGLGDAALALALPMHRRILHDRAGRVGEQLYGPNRECIHSISRRGLNALLLDEAEACSKIDLRFGCGVLDVELATNTLVYREPPAPGKRTGKKRRLRASLIIGADGAFSTVRESVRKRARFDYELQWLDYGYKELTIRPAPDGAHRLPCDGLHIWPRHDMMLIALPNNDGSFTATLFLPFEGPRSFASLTDQEAVRLFFAEEFPDALPLIDQLTESFFQRPTGAMVTTHVAPYHYGEGVVLVGDAAHAIAPFYGQGMNAAFEDCGLLADHITGRFERSGPDARAAQGEGLRAYSSSRIPDARAIHELALKNFIEMRSDVASKAFVLKKRAAHALERVMPERYRSLYSMISFSSIPYADARERAAKQDTQLRGATQLGAAGLAFALAIAAANVLTRAGARERAE